MCWPRMVALPFTSSGNSIMTSCQTTATMQQPTGTILRHCFPNCGSEIFTAVDEFTGYFMFAREYTNFYGFALQKLFSDRCTEISNFGLLLYVFFFFIMLFSVCSSCMRGTRWRSWMKHCATSRKVTGSIPDGVTGIFHWRNPSGCSMTMGLTQPLTEMSTRNISLG